nr:RNA-binding protein cabeza-like isoform X2 [Penaeus vannamei]
MVVMVVLLIPPHLRPQHSPTTAKLRGILYPSSTRLLAGTSSLRSTPFIQCPPPQGGYGHPPPTQAPVQSAPGGGGYSSYEQNSTYGSGSYGQTPASTAYGSQPNANFSTPPAQGNFGGPPPTQGGYGGGPPSGGSYGGPPSSNGNYGGQGGGYNKSGGGSYGSSRYDGGGRGDRSRDSELVTQEDTIFVSGMPDHATEDDIKDHFGSIGIIKMDRKTQRPKIWMYKDKATGRMKGECTVTFDDPYTAKSAIQWFDGKAFMGSNIKVQMAERPKSSYERGRGGGGGGGGGYGGYGSSEDRGSRNDRGSRGDDRGRGDDRSGRGDDRGGRGRGGDRGYDRRGGPGGRDGPGGGGGGRGRAGDWRCDSCGNNNFAWRNACNRCSEPKPAGAGEDDGGGGGGYRGGFRGRGDRGGYRGRGGDRGRGGYRDSGPMKGDRGPGRSRPY